jgi:nucleoside 2-deoxyribosyltransferase
MNILKNTRVYLAGNLENNENSVSWRQSVKNSLVPRGITVLTPIEKMFTADLPEDDWNQKRIKNWRKNKMYDEVHRYMKEVIRKDLRLVDLSDFFIFNIDIKTPTYGTVHELVLASQQRKPVFICVGDKTQCPLWIMGLFSHENIFNSMDEILEQIYTIDDGKIDINPNKWRLLTESLR